MTNHIGVVGGSGGFLTSVALKAGALTTRWECDGTCADRTGPLAPDPSTAIASEWRSWRFSTRRRSAGSSACASCAASPPAASTGFLPPVCALDGVILAVAIREVGLPLI
jgi:hypothetical protein